MSANIVRSSLAILCAAFILYGCSSPSEKEDATTQTHDEKNVPAVYTVQIEQMKFFPSELKVHSGDTVMWINNDMVAHNITEEKNKSWSSELLQPGKSWKLVVTSGADYYCSIHPVMKGALILE